MKKLILIKLLTIFFLLCTTFVYSQEEPELIQQYLDLAIRNIKNDSQKPLVVSIGSITFSDKNLGSEFSAYLEDHLSKSISMNPSFEYFAKDKLEDILKEQEYSISDLVDPSTKIRIGKLKGVNSIIDGNFFDTGTSVKIFLKLVDVETGIATSFPKIEIPKSAIPSSISIYPDNYNDAVYVLNELSKITADNDSALNIKVWTPRGNGATYYENENIVFNIFSTQDCFVKVYLVDAEKKTSLIFPNKYHKNNFIRKNTVYKIPDISYGFNFKLSAPYGTEFIKVVASTVQFKEIEEAFSNIGSASGALIEKGIIVEGKEAVTAESTFMYTIIQK